MDIDATILGDKLLVKSPFHQLTDVSNRMGFAHLSFPAQPSPLKWIGLGLQTLHIATLQLSQITSLLKVIG
jgi:hypothetical protein